MPLFNYIAVDNLGKVIKDRIEAENQEAVISKLAALRYKPLQITEYKPPARLVGGAFGFGSFLDRFMRISLKDLAVFSRQFATMIGAGLHLVRCLDTLERQTTNRRLKLIVSSVLNDINSGASLAEALSRHPKAFSNLYVSMIRSAELGGILDRILDRLATFLEKEKEVRDKIKSAIMYPVIVLMVALAVLVIMTFVVLPKIREIFTGFELELPLPTKLLIGFSNIAVNYWYLPILVAAFVYIIIRLYGKTAKGRLQIDAIKLRLPVVGELIRKSAIAKFARTFGTLISGGVPILRTLEIVGETAGNSVIAEAVGSAREEVRRGERLAVPLRRSGIFPEMVTQMIGVGEETGKLDEMLVKVSDFYEAEVDSTIKGLTSLIEPILIVCLGGIVLLFALSIFTPLFKLVASIK